MQNSQLPAKWYKPFAADDANKVEIPVTTADPSRASQSLGFPPLTMQPPESGGVPPQGEDFNGAMNQVARIVWWMMAGGALPFDSSFAGNVNINGYPNGAKVAAADLQGIWVSTVDNNTVNPDTTNGTNWVPLIAYGTTTVNTTGGTTTLTPAQGMKPRIVVSGALVSNAIIVVPNWVREWTVVNNTSGAFTVTIKASGAGVTVLQGSNARITCDGAVCDYAGKAGATAAQFDASTLYATDEFVQRALGNLSGEISLSGASTLTAASTGNLLFATGGSSFPTTLPLANTCRAGTQLVLFCKLTAGLWTLQRQGSDIIDNNGTINSFTMGPGDTAIVESNNVGTWRLVGGSAALRNSSDFKATTGANAYQTLPSTWIIQRGSITIGAGAAISGNVTLPVAFPVAQRFCAIWANELNNNSSFGVAPAAGNRPVIGTAFPTNASSFAYDARTTDGSSIGTSGTIRLNWISIGE